jgi:hypothetical protein
MLKYTAATGDLVYQRLAGQVKQARQTNSGGRPQFGRTVGSSSADRELPLHSSTENHDLVVWNQRQKIMRSPVAEGRELFGF